MYRNKIILFSALLLISASCTPKSIDDTLEGNLDRRNLLAPENNAAKTAENNLQIKDAVNMAKAEATPSATPSIDPQPMAKQTQWQKPPALVIDATKKYTAALTTDQGEILIELYADKVPNTVNNFVFLSKQGFYDGVIFHRIIDGFMIQGGDPTGTGRGGPGYQFDDEPFTGSYKAGTIAMANAGPDTNGSQFFIMHKDYPLSANYTIFGQVAQGLDVVDTIATAPTKPGGEGSSPVTPVKITKVIIREE